ncbi:MAG TPA: primosomal protein N', partial [Thiolapillus brandeum]|nr:primosomal protein N' [Thiolapillus brandeum]
MSIILRMALPAPVYGLFDYLPPDKLHKDKLVPGQRLLVPFGRTERCGMLVELSNHTSVPRHQLRAAHKLLDEAPLISQE